MFHPEDRRHLWLCSDEDDPAHQGGRHLIKNLYVSLQEYIPHLVYLTLRIFSREVIEVTLFRFRYLDDGTKLVELVRKQYSTETIHRYSRCNNRSRRHGERIPIFRNVTIEPL